MIEQQGRVTGAAGSQVRVRLGGTSGCTTCDAGRGCGAGVFGRLLQRRPVELEFDNDLGAKPGQAVMVGLPESLFLALTLRFYLLPLLAGLAGAVAGHGLASWSGLAGAGLDFAAACGGLLLAAVMLAVNRRRRMEFLPDRAVKLLRIVNPSQG
ncbi:MAG: SoxR reducing system RseC family protein [Xanthomonadales bacterium]